MKPEQVAELERRQKALEKARIVEEAAKTAVEAMLYPGEARGGETAEVIDCLTRFDTLFNRLDEIATMDDCDSNRESDLFSTKKPRLREVLVPNDAGGTDRYDVSFTLRSFATSEARIIECKWQKMGMA